MVKLQLLCWQFIHEHLTQAAEDGFCPHLSSEVNICMSHSQKKMSSDWEGAELQFELNLSGLLCSDVGFE